MVLAEISEPFLSPQWETGADLVVRRFRFPGCALVLDAQTCRPEDVSFDDVKR